MSLFSKIQNKIQPILTNSDLGFETQVFELKVYHPSVLPQDASLTIFDSQTTVDFLADKVDKKAQELEAIKETETLDEKNLQARKEKLREIQELNNQIEAQINLYIETLAKIKPGALNKKIDILYKAANEKDSPYKELLEYPKNKFTSLIFEEIKTSLVDYSNKQLGDNSESSAEEKKQD